MKKSKLATSIALATVFAATPVAMLGCSGDHYSAIKFAAQDTGYAVTSQGGSAVAYGNNIYFVNGYRGYADTNGKANVWDSVVKGGLYRARLNGERDADNKQQFIAKADNDGIAFKYAKGTDYFDNEINVVETTKIAPKTIGTEGYSDGGLFIYDNYAYFASPNNEKNKAGTVQTTRTDFFMMPLNGGKPTKIYTTSEKVDTSSSAYAFYKYGGSVYLLVNENKNIVSVKVNPSKAKADDPVIFKVGATSVYFPVKETYYKGISTNELEDFIYFVREVKESDTQKTGTVIEAMRPDGKENFVVSMTGQTETIEGVRDGLLFYRTTVVNDTKINYTNLHNMLMEHSKSYKKAQDGIADDDKKTTDITGTFQTAVSGSITSTYAFRADRSSNEVFFVGVTSNGMSLYQNDENNPVRTQKLCSSTGTPQFIKDGYLYFAGSSSDYYRVPLFENMDGFGEAQLLAENTSTATFGCDYAAGYFTYYAEVDQWATGYAYFVDVMHEGAEPMFVGQRAASDIPTSKQIEEAKGTTTE